MKKEFIHIISLSTLILLSINSCKQNNNYKRISYKIQDSLHLKVQHQNFSFLKHAQYSKNEEVIILLTGTPSYSHPVLYQYNTLGEHTDSIDLSALIDNKSKLSSFEYLSRDSIFLFLMKHNSENDSLILLTNSKGKLLKSFTPKHPLLASQYFPPSISSLRIDAFSNAPSVIDNRIFFSLYSTNNGTNFNPDSLSKINRPLIGYYDYINNTTVLNTELRYPSIKGLYNTGMYYYNFTINQRGNPVIGFGYTPDLFEWDLKTNKIEKHRISSSLVDTILPENKNLNQQFSETEPNYSLLQYADDLKMYFRVISFPSENFGNFKNITVYSDTLFQSIGEQFNKRIFPISIGGWYYDYSQSNSDTAFTFYKMELQSEPIEKITAQNEMNAYKKENRTKIANIKCSIGIENKKDSKYKPEDFIKYTSERLNVKDSSYVLFTVQNNSCPACVNYLLNFFMINQNVLKEQKFYLLYVSDDYNYTKSELKKFNLANYPLLRQDSSYIYQVFHPSTSDNPRLIVVKDLELKVDSIYPSENIMDMILKSMEEEALERQETI